MPLQGHLRGRQSHRPRRVEGPSATSIASAAVVLVALLGLGIFLFVKSKEAHVSVNSETLCPDDRAISEMTVVILDVSDRFSEPQLLEVQNELTRLRGHISKFGLVEIYTVAGLSEPVPKPIVRLCNPGSGEDLSKLYQNPDLARARWKRDFVDRLEGEVHRLLLTPDSETSPIYEALQAAALRSFGKPEYDGVPKKLVIISDLLQNVPGKQTHYRPVGSFEAFRQAPYFAQIRCDLRDVQATLLYLNRSDLRVQGPDHIRFWEQLLSAEGATVETVVRVYGDR